MCVATMVLLLGMRTHFLPYKTGTLSLHGEVVGRKWLVHPKLDTARSKDGVTRE